MKLDTKLLLSYVSIALFVLFAGYLGLQGINRLENEFTAVDKESIPTLESLEEIRFFALRFVSSTNEISLIIGEYLAEKKSLEGFQSEEQELIKEGQKGYDQALQNYEKIVKEQALEETPFLEKIKANGQVLKRQGLLLVELKQQGKTGEEILEAKEKFEEAERNFLNIVEKAIDNEKYELKEHRNTVQNTISQTNQGEILTITLTFGLAILFGVVIAKKISTPILEISKAAHKIEKGDLNVVINTSSNDEVGQLALSFSRMVQGLKSRDFLSNILSSMSDILIVVDVHAQIIQVNPALIKISEYTENELIGHPLQILFNENFFSDKPTIGEIIQSKLIGKTPDIALRKKDGTIVYLSLSGSLVMNEENHIQAIIFVGQDMTERRKTRLELEKQKEWLQVTLSSIGDAIIITDENENILFLNPVAEQLTGWISNDAIGQPMELVFTIINEETRSPVLSPIKKAIKEGVIVGLANHTILITKDKKEIHIDDSAAPIRYNDGKILGSVLVFRDISTRRKVEKELVDAKRLAESATQAKSQFLATMSHEIRTPLNAVIGMTTILMETPLTKEQYEFAQTIHTSSDNLLAIINNILDFSKIESGKIDLEERAFDLRDCIEEALDLLTNKATEKNLNLAYLAENGVPNSILGDIVRLRQILVNLLSNAIKFTGKGEVVVLVKAKLLEVDKYELTFSVKDTGIGIPPDRMDRLFQSFSQIDASTTRRYGGTGLGLAISKQLVELMGGHIFVESQPEIGTTFSFTFSALSVPSQPRLHSQNTKAFLERKTALIVVNNETNRKILDSQMQSWGMIVQFTSSPKEALELVKQNENFDLAILDSQMLEITGIDLAKEILSIKPAPITPIIMLSSIGLKDTKNNDLEFTRHLTKPIKPAQLYKTLDEIFGKTPKSQLPSIKLPTKETLKLKVPLKILLADDNEVNQFVALTILKKMGYESDVANNGLEVLSMTKKKKYDLIFMDVQMPEMDGLEATRHICNEMPVTERPKIIAMTANATQEDKKMCLASGMDEYISKPIKIEELVTILDKTKGIEEINQ